MVPWNRAAIGREGIIMNLKFSWPTPALSIVSLFKSYKLQDAISPFDVKPQKHPALEVIEKAHGLPIMLKLDCLRVILGGDDFSPEVLEAFEHEIGLAAHMLYRERDHGAQS